MSLPIVELVGRRVLVSLRVLTSYRADVVEEVHVLEVAPSKAWVRLLHEHGRKVWRRANDVLVVEVLHQEVRPTRPRPVRVEQLVELTLDITSGVVASEDKTTAELLAEALTRTLRDKGVAVE